MTATSIISILALTACAVCFPGWVTAGCAAVSIIVATLVQVYDFADEDE